MKITKVLFLAVVSVLAFGTSFQDKQDKNQQKVSQKEIDKAIDKGVKWLLKEMEASLKANPQPNQGDELILYTLTHAGITEKNPVFKKLMERTLSIKPAKKRTYNLALEAMVWTTYDKVRFQERLVECAQALVDRQLRGGQWTYTGPDARLDDHVETEEPKIPPASSNKKGTEALKKISIKRHGWGQGTGDNSNTQYAALGLRACAEANIEIDPEVLKLAKEYYEKHQGDDGGWGYSDLLKNSYGSMTVGGLGALGSYKHLLKEDIKKDPYIQKAIQWMTDNFTVESNPKMRMYHYYYLYGLERAGALAKFEKFGVHNWYWEGAEYLVKHQQSNGAWSEHADAHNQQDAGSSLDTCFAILFLKRATRALVETERAVYQ